MTQPIHETLRAVGQGMLGAAAVAAPFVLAMIYLGPAGLFLAAIGTGAGLITVANALKRREQRQRGGAR